MRLPRLLTAQVHAGQNPVASGGDARAGGGNTGIIKVHTRQSHAAIGGYVCGMCQGAVTCSDLRRYRTRVTSERAVDAFVHTQNNLVPQSFRVCLYLPHLVPRHLTYGKGVAYARQ